MSLTRKISCAQCPHYEECSKETRMYINYCGSKGARVREKIWDAFAECYRRQGYFFKRNFDIKPVREISSCQVVFPAVLS